MTNTSLFAAEQTHGEADGADQSGWADMPVEVKLLILELVDELSWPHCRFVCRQWDELLQRIAYDRCHPKAEDDDDDDDDDEGDEDDDDGDGDDDDAYYEEKRRKRAMRRLMLPKNFIDKAAGEGRLNAVQWARANGCPWGDTCTAAAEGGHLAIVQWAHENGCGWSELTCAAAARGGHLHVLRWLRGCRGDEDYYEPYPTLFGDDEDKDDDSRPELCPWNRNTCLEAAASGHLEVLRWATDHECPWGEERDLCTAAARSGSVVLMEWLRDQGIHMPSTVLDEALEGGHLDLAKWLGSVGMKWTDQTFYKAARSGRVDVIEWVIAEGCPIELRPSLLYGWEYSELARLGHLEVLKWGLARGIPPDRQACSYAAMYGQLEVLKWLRANGAHWDGSTINAAAGGGHLKLIKWAVANGCPLPDGECAMVDAATQGKLRVLKWAHANGISFTHFLCSRAAHARRTRVVKWLIAHGCPVGRLTLQEFISDEAFGMLGWLLDRTKALSFRTGIEAAGMGSLRVLQWLHENGHAWDRARCASKAALHDQLAVVKWIMEQVGCPCNREIVASASRAPKCRNVLRWLKGAYPDETKHIMIDPSTTTDDDDDGGLGLSFF